MQLSIPDLNLRHIYESGQCFRWEPLGQDTYPVSYTHLDVYKRQGKRCAQSAGGSAFCARYQTISEDANMKIAVTYENGLVFQHCLLYTSRCV